MIVLTGGAGFIGSCLLKELNDRNIYDVLVVDNLGSSEKWKNLVGRRLSHYENKTAFRQKINSGFYDGMVEAVFHLGACTVTTEHDADYMLDNNLAYSKELADFTLRNDSRFIYASSAATYGNGDNGYEDNEFYSLKPLNIYGMSKHLFDLWVLDKGLDDKFTGLKFFNVFGPNEYHKGDMASMVFKSYHQIKETGLVKLFKSDKKDYKDGEQMRDFIYVKDVVDTIMNVYDRPSVTGIYNLGTGQARSWNDLMRAVFKAMGMVERIDYIDMPESLSRQYQYYTRAGMDKLIKSGCPFSPQSLEDSVGDYVRNYLMNDWQFI